MLEPGMRRYRVTGVNSQGAAVDEMIDLPDGLTLRDRISLGQEPLQIVGMNKTTGDDLVTLSVEPFVD
jgi:hypothetical protein